MSTILRAWRMVRGQHDTLTRPGDAYETMDFFVLALRYDPSDLTPPYPRIPAGAVDPTGPVILG